MSSTQCEVCVFICCKCVHFSKVTMFKVLCIKERGKPDTRLKIYMFIYIGFGLRNILYVNKI